MGSLLDCLLPGAWCMSALGRTLRWKDRSGDRAAPGRAGGSRTGPVPRPARRPTSVAMAAVDSFPGREQRVELPLEVVVADALVQLLAGLHRVEHRLLVAVATDRLVHGLGRPVHGAERGQRIELDRDA